MGMFAKRKAFAIGRFFVAGIVATTLLAALCPTASAARPSSMKLFPEESVVFIRITNAHDFGERVQQTAIGRMIHDPQLQPLVENLYGRAGKLYADEAEGKLGISWDDLKKLPKGEIAFAVVARPDAKPASCCYGGSGRRRGYICRR